MAGPFLAITEPTDRTTESGVPTRMPSRKLTYTGNMTATEAGTNLTNGIIDVSAYRSIQVATRASAWGTASVVVKVYGADGAGNKTSSPFLTKTISANGNTLDILSEMGGATTQAAWPPTSATGGQVVIPFGNWIVLTETTTFTSGTNTLTIELACKG
jgi:hypothetical protein